MDDFTTDYVFYSIITTLGGIFLYLIIHILVRTPGMSLQSKFAKLGTLTGKTLSEIERTCGKPNSISAMGNGEKLCQWMSTGYHICLIFDSKNICLGVSSEISV